MAGFRSFMLTKMLLIALMFLALIGTNSYTIVRKNPKNELWSDRFTLIVINYPKMFSLTVFLSNFT